MSDELEQLRQALHDARIENSGQAAEIERLNEARRYHRVFKLEDALRRIRDCDFEYTGNWEEGMRAIAREALKGGGGVSEQEINEAIAKACGRQRNPDGGWYPDNGLRVGTQAIPDYCNDLNAMHEAEKVLTAINRPVKGCSEQGAFLSWLGYCGENNTSEVYECITATARQRAEAFLRTLGKWEEVQG